MRKEEHLEELFMLCVFPMETNLLKPNKDAYEDFMNKSGVTPEELIFIDDTNAGLLMVQKNWG